MDSYKVPLTLVGLFVIASFFFLQFFSSLVTSVNTAKLEIQDRRLTLSNEISGLDDILSKSKDYSVSPDVLAKFDLKNGTNFSAEFNGQTVAYVPPSNLSIGEQVYWKLKKEQKSKKEENQKLKDVRIFSLIPSWRLLFVAGLGVVVARLLNRIVDYICDNGSAKPLHTIIGVFVLFAAISIVICCF